MLKFMLVMANVVRVVKYESEDLKKSRFDSH